MRTVKLEEDACEYNPEKKRAVFTGEPWHADASVIVGADGKWRLCESCSRLPEFGRFRIRRQIKHAVEAD